MNETAGNHEASRRANMQRLVELGVDPWGARFDNRDWIGSVRERASEIKFRKSDGTLVELPDFNSASSNSASSNSASSNSASSNSASSNSESSNSESSAGETFDYRKWKSEQGPGEEIGPTVRVAGRILLQRPTGKLIFLNIRDWTGDLQIFIGQRQVGESNWELAKYFDLGDLVGAEGRLGRTNTGELTVFAERLFFFAKTLEPPPEKFHGLTDPELRQRRRYVDLLYSPGVLETFRKRTKIVQSIRRTLDESGFFEIEGPTLHAIAGGAAARPFKTHHNALDIDLVLRIALELHLKRLLVGGMERVYELGRVYRNEGISQRHNPEFTMLEVYEAYGDYGTMMDLVERLICKAIESLGGTYKLSWGDSVIDFTPPFARKTYDELFQTYTKVDPTDAVAIRDLAVKIGLEVQGKHPDVIKSEVFEARVEHELKGPIFVMDYPASICPLTKRKANNPALAERFELYAEGMELANAYTELNDPDLQEQLFRTQLEGLADEESMARMDHDFIRALRNGMPPAGGLGVGIDRLVMLLTNSRSIREVILFPLLRPESH